MITDEEHRERAKNLRDMVSARNYGIPGTFGSFVDIDEFLTELLDRRVYDSQQAIRDVEALSIADLIDRQTCLDLVEHKQDPFIPGKRMVDGYFHCSDCGWDGQIWEHIGFGDMLAYEAVHCPKCGAIIERRA